MSWLATFQFRRDTAANWTASNPVLLDGELGIETDTDQFKLGDGTTPWTSLPYGGIKGDTGATGPAGNTGATGAAGTNGWSPILAVENDGERRVLRLVDWTGGTGTKPATGSYLGPAGFVATAAQATDIRGPQGATGVAPTQNTFATVSVGTAPTPTLLVSDAAADVLSINAGAGISLTADAATDTFSIVNIDTGSAARAAHEAAADPHPQYLTQPEADSRYQPIGGGVEFVSSIHTATQSNNTTTAQDLTGQVFTVPPGKTLRLQGNLIFTAAATTTGAFYGFRVAQGAGASGPAIGSWNAEVALSSAAVATGLADGDSINAAAGATVASGVLGTGSTAGNNSAWIMLTVRNTSTNVNTTVALQFRSEVALSAVTAQVGTSAAGVIG